MQNLLEYDSGGALLLLSVQTHTLKRYQEPGGQGVGQPKCMVGCKVAGNFGMPGSSVLSNHQHPGASYFKILTLNLAYVLNRFN